jgi:acetate kinase
MADAVLTINAGSSSLKFSLWRVDGEAPALALEGQIEGIGTTPHMSAKNAQGKQLADRRWDDAGMDHAAFFRVLGGWLREQLGDARLAGVGHRVVHGGTEFAAPVRIDEEVLAKLERLCPLAPLHQPHNLAGIRAVAAAQPDLPQVACFDTAFHRAHPELADWFALPRRFHDDGIRRYGFHGLSYEYIAQALPAHDSHAAAGKVVVLHLGNGSSMCAIAGGRSIASTMGFTAVDGLPMGTRCGSLDPGVLLYLLDELGMDARAIEKLIYQQSGLLGVSGISSDMRTLEASDEPGAKAAIALYVYRIGRELGSLAAALGGVDAIVFTAGIGENSRSLREKVCRDAAWLGVDLDAEANAAARDATRISSAASRVSAWVLPTNEELMIARHTRAAIGAGRIGSAGARGDECGPGGPVQRAADANLKRQS